MTTLWMGCGGQIDPSRLEACESTGLYVAEPKCDGIWAVCLAHGAQRFFSRKGHEKVLRLPQLPSGTIVVGELGYGSQAATMRVAQLGHPFMDVFDLLQVRGSDMRHLDDNQRREVLEDAWASWSPAVQTHFPLVPRHCHGFRALYEAEAEGLVLKQVRQRAHQPYVCGHRNPYWFKVKRRFTVEMVLMAYTLSEAASFTGLTLARCVTCGVYKDGTLLPLVNVGAFPIALKVELVRHWPRYQGTVVEIACFKVFTSGALRHPSLVRLREDKTPHDCTWEALMALAR
jgi:ATP-dependent DNA ligase